MDSVEVRQAAEQVISTINNLTSSRETVCARLTLDSVTSAVRYTAGADLLRFKRSSDVHGRVADLSDKTKISQASFIASFIHLML